MSQIPLGHSDRCSVQPAPIASLIPHCDIRNLQALRLSYNQLEELPDELGALTKLKYLPLSSNPLRRFPPVLKSLPRLEVLYLDQAGIEEIPAGLPAAGALLRLSLSGKDVEPHSRSIFAKVAHCAPST